MTACLLPSGRPRAMSSWSADKRGLEMARRKCTDPQARYLSTHQVARMLGVSPPAVVNWVNQGLLAAHRTPGGHRRISPVELERFARAHDYPLPPYAMEASLDLKVLVVDDQEEFCELVRDYLMSRGGCAVEVAGGGFQAGLCVAAFKPHVILLDILMPGMDGFHVLKRLRSDPKTAATPVIACTAQVNPAMDLRMQASGFDLVLHKPLEMSRLWEALQRFTPKECLETA